ncbi:copper-exporting ATPase [Leptospira ryugenii]|uniref:P-type Cu(2+) transporter n=1 Tax=Leptospira ryugenii TaxID=1917863 RepID=A0A2P2E3M4_9LEPT|nr:copper-exporting ATPase [Leptospira ryugenii]
MDTQSDLISLSSKSQTFSLIGMTCANCALRIERGLSKVPGVEEVRVNFARESVYVTTNKDVSDESLIQKIKDLGYSAILHDGSQLDLEDQKQRAYIKSLKLRFFISCILSLPLFYGMVSHFSFLSFLPMYQLLMEKWFQALLATPVQFGIGFPFYLSAFRALKNRGANMDLLVVLGTSAAYGFSWYGSHLYFETSSVLITFILLGKWLEHSIKADSSEGIKSLLKLKPDISHIERNDLVIDLPTDYVREGDVLFIKSGERFPVDGKIIDGESYVDESMLTGESFPVQKQKGDTILTGTINGNGSLRVLATKVGKDTTLSNIIQSVEIALGTKAPIQRVADQISSYFVPLVISIALINFFIYYFLISDENFIQAFETSIAILVIACPCALGLATPISLLVATDRAAKRGILFRNAEALETVAKITKIGFDKTGTLTEGKPTVVDWAYTPINSPSSISHHLSVLVMMESQSEHPLAKAIQQFGKVQNVKLLTRVTVQTQAGMGLSAVFNQIEYRIGNRKWIESLELFPSSELETKIELWQMRGKTIVYAAFAGKENGILVFAIEDPIRATARSAIQTLQTMGIETILLTGDTVETAKRVAEQVGIKRFYGNLLPQDKVSRMDEIFAQKDCTAMVGDGINDAPVLAKVHVGIAMGTGSDVAIRTADVVLIKGDLDRILELILIGKQTVSNIRQNFIWALGYNLVGIPIAGMGLLAPWLSGAAMAFSSVSVVLNALRLKGKVKVSSE